jgi:hypothetical protein
MNDPLARRASIAGWGGSLAMHALAIALAMIVLEPPDTGFEFQAPTEIELGLVEATAIEPPAPVAPPPVDPPTPATPDTQEGLGAQRPRRDAGPPADAQRRRRRDAGYDGGLEAPGIGSGPPVAFLPAGAQIALRIDMDRIRSSPLGDDVRALLRVVPDWQALLGESGIDPVRDLSRVLVATPTLRRETIVVAGRLSPEAADPRSIAEALATSRGVAIEWRDEAGVPATAWPSPDPTEREVALVGERHFVIARPQDLPRVLAIAAARRTRRGPIEESAADALLSMGEGEGLSVEVENVAAFTRRSPCPVAQRLRVGVVETADGADVRGEARFATADEATEARECLGQLAERASRNVIVALYGLDGPLERLDLAADGTTLRVETAVRTSELRVVMNLLRGLLERPPPGGPGTALDTGASPPTGPPPSPFE